VNELKSMLRDVDLQVSEVRSTILQPPTEEPLHFEPSKKGHYNDAGFVAIKTQKRR